MGSCRAEPLHGRAVPGKSLEEESGLVLPRGRACTIDRWTMYSGWCSTYIDVVMRVPELSTHRRLLYI